MPHVCFVIGNSEHWVIVWSFLSGNRNFNMKPSGKVGNVRKKTIPDVAVSIYLVLPAMGVCLFSGEGLQS